PASRLEHLVVLDCGRVVSSRQICQPVPLAPEPELELGGGRGRELLLPGQVFVERAGLGNHLEDLLALKGQRVPTLEQQHLDRVRLLGVDDDLSLDLAAAPQLDGIGHRLDACTHENRQAQYPAPYRSAAAAMSTHAGLAFRSGTLPHDSRTGHSILRITKFRRKAPGFRGNRSPPPCLTKPEMSTADRIGSREASSRAGPPQ